MKKKDVYMLDVRKVRQIMPADAALVFLIPFDVFNAYECGVLDDVVLESGLFPIEVRVGPRNESRYWDEVRRIAGDFGFTGWMVNDEFFEEFEQDPSTSPSVLMERIEKHGCPI